MMVHTPGLGNNGADPGEAGAESWRALVSGEWHLMDPEAEMPEISPQDVHVCL